MLRNRGYLLSFFVFFLLIGCTSNNSAVIESENAAELVNTKIDQITRENDILKEQVKELQKRPSETFMMDLRETMNLSFKIIQAMDSKDYEFLKSVSSSGVKIDQENNQVVFNYGEDEVRMDFLNELHFGNLEYWGSGYTENEIKFQIIFAHFFEDTHGTIYIDFIKEDNQWMFNGFMTNA